MKATVFLSGKKKKIFQRFELNNELEQNERAGQKRPQNYAIQFSAVQ